MIAVVAFDLSLEHGRCVGVRIPSAEADLDALVRGSLWPAERDRALAMPLRRRRTWTGGRAAMREALARAGAAPGAVASDDRGAPVLPQGVSGSITHKETLAAALVAFEARARVGVDVELDAPRSLDIAPRILTPAELEAIADLDPEARAREVLLRFSAKEAVYKALDPFLRRYIGFLEVEVAPRPDGTAGFTSHLPPGEGPFHVDVRWRRFDTPLPAASRPFLPGIVLTTARAEPA